ncbi:MAG: CAP domain-containing protein [Bacteroidota bacterium]
MQTVIFVFTSFYLFYSSPADSEVQFQQAMLKQVNQLRAAGCTCGDQIMPPAPAVVWNDQLSEAALTHAQDMDRYHFIGHKGHDGSKISERVARTAYPWRAIGENISWNASSLDQAMLGWKDSPGHCVTMMSRSFREMGAARQGRYMVQVFGRQW